MKWTIDRQELVLFHARHKRLRFFYEDIGAATQYGSDHAEFARYRQHAQEILGTLRKVLNRFHLGTEISIDNDNQSAKSPDSHQNQCILILNLPDDLDRDIFIAYLVYWRECLTDEGWIQDTIPFMAITEMISKFHDIKNKSISLDKVNNQELTKSVLIHLASSLPILPHWDVPGVFSKKSNKNKDKKSLFGKIRECTKPVYAVQLKYKSPEISGEEPPPSKRLLGYSARLRACYAESDQGALSTIFVREDDYYRYCHDPEEGERELYRAYGLLVDALNIALQGNKDSQESKGGNANSATKKKCKVAKDEKILFYIAYPITTSLGRTHFWHIWVRPEDPSVTLEQLWASWWPIHQHLLDWPTLHASLATELEQLDIAYAQESFLHDIKGSIRNVKEEEVWLNELVCRYGNMLFPATCFCAGRKDKWAYVPYEWSMDKEQKTPGHIKKILGVGKSWEIPAPGMDLDCDTCPWHEVTGNIVRFREDFPSETKDLHRLLLSQRYRRLVEQQRFLAEQMLSAHRHQTNLRKDEIQTALAKLRAQVNEIEPEKRRAAIAAILGDTSNWKSVALGYQELADIRSGYIENTRLEHNLNDKTDPTDDELRAGFILLIETDLHTFISWYLESEPVRSLSHKRQVSEWGGFLQGYRDLHKTWRKIIEQLCLKHLTDALWEDARLALLNLLGKVAETLEAKAVSQEVIECISAKRECLRCSNAQVTGWLNSHYSPWTYPPEENTFAQCWTEFHLPLEAIWNGLPRQDLINFINAKDDTAIKLSFRFLLSRTTQNGADGKNKDIFLYRNCLAFAYGGHGLINFVEQSDRKDYPEEINDLVGRMNQLQIGKLFYGFGNGDCDRTYYHITERNKKSQRSLFSMDGSGSSVQGWFEKTIAAKEHVLIISLDGWDGS